MLRILLLFVCLGSLHGQEVEVLSDRDLAGPLNPSGGGEPTLPPPVVVSPPESKPTPPEPQPIVVKKSLTDKEKASVLQAHNDIREKKNLASFSWSDNLEINANMVVDCNIEFPGPAPTYTNFGKSKVGPLSDVVDSWGNEGPNLEKNSLATGCRPSFYGGIRCNHYSNMMWSHLRRIGCAKKDCEDRGTQITCVYIDYEDFRPYEDMFGGSSRYQTRYGRRRR